MTLWIDKFGMLLRFHNISPKIFKGMLKIFVTLLCLWVTSNQASNDRSLHIQQTKIQTNKSRLLNLSELDTSIAVGKYLSIYKDFENNKTISEIVNLKENNWQPSLKSIPSFGYQNSTVWFRLRVLSDLNRNLNYLINIANSNLDEVNIHIFKNDSLLDSFQFGDHFPFSQREINDRYFLTPIELNSNSQYDIYISVFNLGTLQVPLYLQSHETVASENQSSLLLWGIYFGLTMIMTLYNFILYLSVRDRSYLLFSLFILANVLLHACLQGFGFQYVWPKNESVNEWLLPTSNASVYVFGGLFISQFVKLKSISSWQYIAMMFVVFTSTFMLFASPWLPYQISVYINTTMGFPFALVGILASVTALRKGNQEVRFFLVSWVIFAVAAFILTANKLGFIPRNVFTENGIQIGNALSILFISLALADRINIEKKQRISSGEETLRLEKEARANKEKQFELELQAKEAELKAQSEIITAREEVLLAKAKSKTKSNFLATMSHEIRTPLNGILGMSGMLSETILTSKQQDILDVITSSGRSLLNLINDILDLSKIESGKMEMECRVFDVHQLHRETIRNFELLAKDKSIQLVCEIAQNVPQYIKSDSNRFQQILLNLLGNALKFTEKGSVRLKVSCIENTNSENQKVSSIIKTEVIDSGIGMTEKQQSKLFQSFSQADSSTTRKYGGTGLGLSISKKITELLGGNIGVISKRNEGSNFWFDTPNLRMNDEEVAEFKREQCSEIKDEKQQEIKDKLEGLTVLVAEDNKVNQMVIKGMLSKLGLKCYIAENGKEALEYVKNYYDEINAVLMDCEMPVMDGYQATREIRAWEKAQRKQSLPILAVTAHALKEMVQDSLDAGMDGHISKPIDKQILHDALLKHLLTQ